MSARTDAFWRHSLDEWLAKLPPEEQKYLLIIAEAYGPFKMARALEEDLREIVNANASSEILTKGL